MYRQYFSIVGSGNKYNNEVNNYYIDVISGDSVEISRCIHKKWRYIEDNYEKAVYT